LRSCQDGLGALRPEYSYSLQERVLVGSFRHGDLQCRPDLRRQRLVLRKPEQPIQADGIALGNAAQGIGAWQAERRAGKQLRQGRSVDADRLGKGGARRARTLNEHLQPLAKNGPKVALIHSYPSVSN
jgi:hypothetical protein